MCISLEYIYCSHLTVNTAKNIDLVIVGPSESLNYQPASFQLVQTSCSVVENAVDEFIKSWLNEELMQSVFFAGMQISVVVCVGLSGQCTCKVIV